MLAVINVVNGAVVQPLVLLLLLLLLMMMVMDYVIAHFVFGEEAH